MPIGGFPHCYDRRAAGIIINKALGIDGNEPTVSITEIYEKLSETVSDIVQTGYDASMAEVERLISDGGYDRSFQ